MCKEYKLVFLLEPSGLLDYAATESEVTAPPELSHIKSNNSSQNTIDFLEQYIGYDNKTNTVNARRSHPFVEAATVDLGAQIAGTTFAPHLGVKTIGPVSAKSLIHSLPTAEFLPHLRPIRLQKPQNSVCF